MLDRLLEADVEAANAKVFSIVTDGYKSRLSGMPDMLPLQRRSGRTHMADQIASGGVPMQRGASQLGSHGIMMDAALPPTPLQSLATKLAHSESISAAPLAAVHVQTPMHGLQCTGSNVKHSAAMSSSQRDGAEACSPDHESDSIGTRLL